MDRARHKFRFAIPRASEAESRNKTKAGNGAASGRFSFIPATDPCDMRSNIYGRFGNVIVSASPYRAQTAEVNSRNDYTQRSGAASDAPGVRMQERPGSQIRVMMEPKPRI